MAPTLVVDLSELRRLNKGHQEKQLGAIDKGGDY